MKLSELLDHLAVTVLDDRADMLNGAASELWSDEALVRWLNEGARYICRRAWVLEDVGHATAGVITLVENTKDYALHKSVVRVLSGRLSDTDLDLARVPYDLSRPQSSNLPDFFYPDVTFSEDPGRPLAISTDVATRILRVRPKPDATAALLTLQLRVSRMPVVELDVASPNAEPEIPPEFHMALTDYAAGEALSIPAADANLRTVAKVYKDKWAETVATAREERQRAEMSPAQWRMGNGGPRG